MNNFIIVEVQWGKMYDEFSSYLTFRDLADEWIFENIKPDGCWAGSTKWGFRNPVDALAFKLKFGL